MFKLLEGIAGVDVPLLFLTVTLVLELDISMDSEVDSSDIKIILKNFFYFFRKEFSIATEKRVESELNNKLNLIRTTQIMC